MLEDAVLKAESLGKAFHVDARTITALDGVSFAIHPGTVTGLIGPDGAGKTTFMRILSGLLKPDSGAIRFRGEPLGHGTSKRSGLGYCPQRIVVWRDLTCIEQLVFVADMFGIPRRKGKERARELLAMLGLDDESDKLGADLSGGMQRRLSLAISMVHDPDIYLFDEPAAGLDPQSRVLVRERIRSLSRERHKTIIVSTHDILEADRLADQVAIIDRGKLLALGSPQRLKNTSGRPNLIEVVLQSASPEEGDRTRRALLTLNSTVRLFGTTLLMEVDDGAELIRPIKVVLGKLGITPSELRHRARTLEDVFIDLTGRSLRE